MVYVHMRVCNEFGFRKENDRMPGGLQAPFSCVYVCLCVCVCVFVSVCLFRRWLSHEIEQQVVGRQHQPVHTMCHVLCNLDNVCIRVCVRVCVCVCVCVCV